MIDNFLRFRRAEVLILAVATCLALLDCVIVVVRDVAIDGESYARNAVVAACLVLVGVFYRTTGRSERIAASTICAGGFIWFTMCLAAFNYLLLPAWGMQIDHHLVRLDSYLGYHWPDVVAFGAQNPLLNEAMRWAYLSTLPQFTLLVVLLGLTGRFDDLYEMIAMVTLSASATVTFWAVFPSIGPSALFDLPADVLAVASPIVGPDYGRTLTALLAEGATRIAPDEAKGLVALPSYHTVLACAAVYYCRNLKLLLPVFVVLNVIVVPAVLVHGGHHLVDIAGGVLVFAASVALAKRFAAHRPQIAPAAAVRVAG
ncbi:phosphatase PAP2 family protein [Methylopila sp. M107]|uniref:phosphatase PAP2 family protein n=1 Tax=Methylopila sp. M107 TaxID=1101190 RepID=UPI00037CC7E4|nr:phosphatase PAP2 family protein [Methylopila sp. M107]